MRTDLFHISCLNGFSKDFSRNMSIKPSCQHDTILFFLLNRCILKHLPILFPHFGMKFFRSVCQYSRTTKSDNDTC